MSRQVARPVRLQAGDLIGLCAPSGYVEIERLHAGAAALERLGFRVLVPEGLFDQSGFTAGSVARRVQELRSLFANDAVRGIVCARGGAGAFQLLPHLFDREWTAPAKVFQGYSDITFLHTALNARGCVTFHGPMAARGLDQAFDEDSLRRAWMGGDTPWSTPRGMLRALRPGSAEGVLRGGCLSILAAAAGTPWALVLNEPTILFLEDIGEPAYRIDRLLMQLRHSDAFAQVAGVVLGEMQDCDGEGVDRDALDRIVLSALDGLDVPIAAGLPSGHTAGAGVTLPFNVRARLTCGDAAHLEILEHGVR